MAVAIDLIEDVNQKFTNTVVMYKHKAVSVKVVLHNPDKNGEFILQAVAPNARSYTEINLNDPDLNYQTFNIGYANDGMYAAWWYRRPQKQWQQGLKASQMGWKVSNQGAGPNNNFTLSKPFVNMLENSYPSIEECKKLLMGGDDALKYHAVAFHRDFALSYDELHEDYLLEYHGIRIGTSIDSQLKQFKIKSEARHLIEALQEARNVHP